MYLIALGYHSSAEFTLPANFGTSPSNRTTISLPHAESPPGNTISVSWSDLLHGNKLPDGDIITVSLHLGTWHISDKGGRLGNLYETVGRGPGAQNFSGVSNARITESRRARTSAISWSSRCRQGVWVCGSQRILKRVQRDAESS